MGGDLIENITNWDVEWSKRFPVRLTGKQKERFLQALEQELQQRHFETERKNIWYFLRNRLLITQCERPRVIFLALVHGLSLTIKV